MKPITFCITSAFNEKDYTILLLDSLKEHTEIENHEILVFVDTDNQNTYERLLEYKQGLPNLRICKNHTGQQTGCQRNVSTIFDAATNEIVCYLQSDMVVGQNFDKHIIENMNEDIVLSCARIEPPLHPPSPEKIIKDFGKSPEEFKYEEFKAFVKELQAENRPNMFGHFAPFVVYKKTWFEKLGGFDTQFRSSREDSDMIIRMHLAGLDMVQSWNACVYHFTCVSSRGQDWYKTTDEAKYKNELQSLADQQELKKFIRKWGFFGHDPRPVYNIAFELELDIYANLQFIKYIEPFCSKFYISDESVVNQLIDQLEFDTHYYNNLRWRYPFQYWQKTKHLFNPVDFKSRIIYGKAGDEDVIIRFKLSELAKNFNDDVKSIIENAHVVVNQNNPGKFAFGPLTIEINRKVDKSKDMVKIGNIDKLLANDQFLFV